MIATTTPPLPLVQTATTTLQITPINTVPLASTTTDIIDTAPAPIDLTGLLPGISGIAATSTATSTIISWDTADQVSDSVVHYGTSANYTATSTGPALSLNHAVTLQNLLPGTQYHYSVSSTNGYGTEASPDQIFTTPGSLGTSTPPTLSMLTVLPPVESLDTTALVSWTTDQPTAGWVLYGPTAQYGSMVNEDANDAATPLGEDHVFLLTGLSPSMTYHFKAVSQNAEGMWSASADQTFNTAT